MPRRRSSSRPAQIARAVRISALRRVDEAAASGDLAAPRYPR
jgi:hypothetical protein